MTQDRLQQIEDLYHAAREASSEERAALLEQAGPELRREVESLLAHENDRLILDRAAQVLDNPTVTVLNPGACLGPYRIESKLGEGGMGEVFRAVDTRLGRAVAVKVTREQFSARFGREAGAISSLNHPNICTLYDIGPNYLVMELLEGDTVAARLKKGPLPVDQALRYASQIAAAIAHAHEHGIVHRDLKPGNVMLVQSGVKVLDFGVATREGEDTITGSRMVIGTPAYMAPEQREGKPADARTDIYSFGRVLYEMLTGARVGPQWKRIRPRKLGTIVNRCLEEDPGRRWQSAAELQQELAAVSLVRPRAYMVAGAAAILALAAATAYFSFHRPATKAETLLPLPLTSDTGWEHAPSFSPDGDQIAYTWDGGEKPESSGIYVMRIGSGKPLRITGMATAKNSPPSPDGSPAWSPDGRMIAFLRSPDTAGGIYVVPPLGGLERKVVEGSFSGRIGWSPDGSHIAVAVVDAYWSSSLYLVAVTNGEKFRLTAPPGSKWADRDPAFSPNGRDLVFARCEVAVRCALYLLRLGATYRPVDGIRRLTQEGGSIGGVAWTADGTEVVYGFSDGMSATHLEKIRIEAGAQPQRVTLAVNSAFDPAVAPRGNRLAFVLGIADIDMWNIQPGKSPRRFASSTRAEYNPQYSPDGTRVVFSSNRTGVMQIWSCDTDGANPIQLTHFDTGPSGSPRWSPDGRWIAFDQLSNRGWRLFVMAAEGGQVRKVTTDEEEEIIPSWSSDGKRIYYSSNRTGRSEIWNVPARGGKGTQFTHNGGIVAFGSLDRHTMYFTKISQNLTDVWKIPMEGGEEKRVLQSVWGRSVTVVDDGIYYIPDFRPDNSRGSIRFHRFATSENVEIAPFKLRPLGGMTVSPDRKTILVSGYTSYGGNLMVVDNFR